MKIQNAWCFRSYKMDFKIERNASGSMDLDKLYKEIATYHALTDKFNCTKSAEKFKAKKFDLVDPDLKVYMLTEKSYPYSESFYLYVRIDRYEDTAHTWTSAPFAAM